MTLLRAEDARELRQLLEKRLAGPVTIEYFTRPESRPEARFLESVLRAAA